MTPQAATAADAVADLHRDWTFGWDRNEGDGPFNLREKFGRYYDWTPNGVLLYDDFDPQHRVARSADDYGLIWAPGFNAMRSAVHRIAEGPHVVTSGDLSASWLVFVARLEALDGEVTGIRTTTSLVWRRLDGGWRIIREHNSSVVLKPDELEAAMGKAASRDSRPPVSEPGELP